MSNMPTDLSPEATAWMQTQIAISNARITASLKAEIDRVDDWANGLFVLMSDVLPYLLIAHPELARQVKPEWQRAAEDFDRIDVYGLPAHPDEPLEVLEARKIMLRTFEIMGVWKAADKALPKKQSTRSHRP